MKVGVTGGAGFIGGHVVDELELRGHDAVIFDHRARSHRRWNPEVMGKAWPGAHMYSASGEYDLIPTMIGDTRDEVAVTELAAHVDGIIHLASVLGTQETVNNPRPAVMTNVQSGMNVLEAATQYGIPVVNICVGNHGMSNPYSASKTCVETLGHMYVRDRGTKLNQVRVVNAYGPRQLMAAPYGPGRVRKIMPAFIARALTGRSIEIYGDGEQVSDCVHVQNVAETLVAALECAAKGQIIDQVVEVGPSEHRTVNQVAQAVVDVATLFGFEPQPLTHLPMRPGETPGARVTANNQTMQMVGLDPDQLIGLEAGVSDTVSWYIHNWLPGWKAGATARG